jgi:uncharacterized membrane protein
MLAEVCRLRRGASGCQVDWRSASHQAAISWLSGDQVRVGQSSNAYCEVHADTIFTVSSVVSQPVTGLAMARLAGFPLPWLQSSIALYSLIGCCWLPVVWLQVRMRNLPMCAVRDGTASPIAYARCYRCWFYLGSPAFIGALVIFYLMDVKPAI